MRTRSLVVLVRVPGLAPAPLWAAFLVWCFASARLLVRVPIVVRVLFTGLVIARVPGLVLVLLIVLLFCF